MNTIKHLKPKASSRYDQGYIRPSACKKLFESQRNKPIIFRSSWEKIFVWWLEHNEKVFRWGSEVGAIKYTMPNGTTHNYYPDFAVEFTDGIKWLVEIKPYAQTQKPKNPKDLTAVEMYTKNMCKWNAATKLCKLRGWKFVIVTEHTINKIAMV